MFLVMRAGPVTSLVGEAHISREQVDEIRQAVSLADTRRLDAMLAPLLSRATLDTRTAPE